MKPLRLTARNFRSYRSLDLQFPQGCLGLLGANGSGKSTLVDALDVSLFGPRGRSLEPYVTSGEDEMWVQLEFDHAGETYRVRRSYTMAGRGKSLLDLERLDDGLLDQWQPLTGATAADTQTHLERLLGFTRETFDASALLRQGAGNVFTGAPARDRKRILTDTLGLGLWDDLLELARVDRRDTDRQDQDLAARLSLLAEQAAGAEEAEREARTLALQLDVCEEDLEGAAQAVASLDQRAQAADQQAAQYAALTAAVQLARTRAEAARRVGIEAQVARERADGACTELKALEGLAQEHADITTRVRGMEEQERSRAQAFRDFGVLSANRGLLASELMERETQIGPKAQWLGELENASAKICDRCGQTLADEALETALASLRAEIVSHDEAAAALNLRIAEADVELEEFEIPDPVEGLDTAQARLADLSDAPTRLAMQQAQLASLEQTIAQDTAEYRADLAELEHELAEAEIDLGTAEPPEPGTAQRLRQALADARAEHARISAARDTLRTTQARAQHLWEQAVAAQARVDEHATERDRLAGTLHELGLLERAFGRDGVPAHIVENVAVPQIEQDARRYLAQLGGPVQDVELRTERALKSGEGTRDTLDIVCLTADGERAFETFSGSEQTRVEIALRIALARLLANRRGAESRLLVLDEPAGLDSGSAASLVDLLRELEQERVFETIALVSHQADLRDAFDASLLVERVNGQSTVVMA